MNDGLRKFALALVEHCAIIGELHQDPLSDGTAGDHIRAMFGMRDYLVACVTRLPAQPPGK
jgi:hypothetical protein